MCGIYGSTVKYASSQVEDKLRRTAFRGPDQLGQETYETNNGGSISFGHNRLSIIDLDPRSNQPLTYKQDIHIVFNGEVYNFKDIKKDLVSKGYEFNTTSDTEVLCAAYLEHGEDCVKHFDGMFAFVIYDVKKQRLFGARDRLGQKPFYYYHKGRDFEFASQISSIQLHNPNLTISDKAISYYLAWGNVPDPYSIFNEVKKLPPGHSFTFDLSNGNMNQNQYWEIDYTGKSPFQGSYEEAKEELRGLLSKAVSGRLFADVPVGVFLSGGVDSSLVSAVATATSSAKIKTFAVKFNETGFDESAYAQKVADHIKSDHHVIECNYDEGMDLINDFSHYYDEPFSDSSAIPSMLLAKYTRKHVTVALSGDGGDESFIGYERYQWANRESKLYKLPYALRHAGASLLNLSPVYRHKVISKGLKIKDVNQAYISVLTGIDLSWIDTNHDYYDVGQKKYLETSQDLLERISNFDLKTYLNWDINTKVDRATMAVSLEARAPLLDHHVVDFARSLPTDHKFGNGDQKRILKDLLYEYVPREIFDRPKSGFTMPFARWFKEDLKDYVMSELDDAGLKSIPGIDVDNVKFRIDQHMTGTWNRYPMIWRLIVLKQWLSRNGKGYSIQ